MRLAEVNLMTATRPLAMMRTANLLTNGPKVREYITSQLHNGDEGIQPSLYDEVCEEAEAIKANLEAQGIMAIDGAGRPCREGEPISAEVLRPIAP
eukprot:765285-Prorocentrum_lima.AAC.1